MPATRRPPRFVPPHAASAKAFEKTLLELTSLPTAAGREDRVVAWIKRWVAKRAKRVRLGRDAHGNLLLAQRRGPSAGRAPLLITAHLDHPAFVVRSVAGREVELEFRGGVHDPYFERAKLDIVDRRNRSHPATVFRLDGGAKPFKLVTARLAKPTTSIAPGDIGRWKLPAPRIAKGLLETHACDDLAAAAAALCAFDRILDLPDAGHVGILFTRAEEIGFVGAIAAARDGSIPRNTRLICLENSRSFAESPIGGGAIVRVGDRMSVFSPELTNRVAAVVAEFEKHAPGFRWQRKLMAGGACEATAFATYGYASTCLCLPLGNYHNMVDIDGVLAGARPAKVGREFVSIEDFHGLVAMLEALARDLDSAAVPPLKDRMESLWREHSAIVGTSRGAS
jgi:endoglucanase